VGCFAIALPHTAATEPLENSLYFQRFRDAGRRRFAAGCADGTVEWRGNGCGAQKKAIAPFRCDGLRIPACENAAARQRGISAGIGFEDTPPDL
jgi:hypothetical protein